MKVLELVPVLNADTEESVFEDLLDCFIDMRDSVESDEDDEQAETRLDYIDTIITSLNDVLDEFPSVSEEDIEEVKNAVREYQDIYGALRDISV